MMTIREKLESDYYNLLKEYTDNQELYKSDEDYIELRKRVVDAHNDLKFHKDQRLMSLIMFIAVAIFGCIVISPSNLILFFLIWNTSMIGLLIHHTKKMSQNRQIMNEGMLELTEKFPDKREAHLINSFALEYDNNMHENLGIKIKLDKKLIDALYDTLSSDDFFERIVHYSEDFDYFSNILIDEWQEYLRDLETKPISEIHLNDNKALLDIEPITLNNKEVKKTHKLAIK